jgi:glutamate receptor, ionotropic, invertebrate
MHELLKKYDNKGFTVTVRELDITDNENYRPQLRRVKHSEDLNVIISCSIETLPEILKQAQQVGLLTDKHQFIISSLDFHTIDLEPFQHSGANITGIRLVVPEDIFVVQITEFFAEKYVDKMKKEKEKEKNSKEKDESDIDDDDDEKTASMRS